MFMLAKLHSFIDVTREIFETKNLARVISYIDSKAKEQELTIEVILLLHKMLLTNIRDDVAGRVRINNEWVRVANHIAPDPKEVVSKLQKMLTLGSGSGSASTNIDKCYLFAS